MGYLSCRADSSTTTCQSISNKHLPSSPRRIRRFTHEELESATSHFSESSLLGRGSHGSVHLARLPSGKPVAVKRPSRVRHLHTPVRLVPSSSPLSSLDNEIHVLSRFSHPRIVNLLGFTAESRARNQISQTQENGNTTTGCGVFFQKERLLVTEYMPNGTLFELLHSTARPPGWPRRLRIALQTAKALQALHSLSPPLVHRDVKSANVLLDDAHNARLSDFGLAVFCDGRFGSGISVFPPAGTLGYLDPGYVTPENLSTKTDVFSFGILLLEIISGRKAMDVAHSPPSIVEWAVPVMRKGRISALFDPRIPPPGDAVVRRQLVGLAASCVRETRDRRPSMEEVVERLNFLTKFARSKAWNGLTVGNPCSVVEADKNQPRVRENCEVHLGSDSFSVEDRSLNQAVVAVRLSRNARRVFSDAASSAKSKNPESKVVDKDEQKKDGSDLVLNKDEQLLGVCARSPLT